MTNDDHHWQHWDSYQGNKKLHNMSSVYTLAAGSSAWFLLFWLLNFGSFVGFDSWLLFLFASQKHRLHVCRAEFINSMHQISLLTSLLNDLSSLCPLPRLVQLDISCQEMTWSKRRSEIGWLREYFLERGTSSLMSEKQCISAGMSWASLQQGATQNWVVLS